MTTIATLYKRDSKGKTRVWIMDVEGDHYWSTSGLLEGKKIVNDPTYVTGKNIGRANETTPEEQALSEAQSEVTYQLNQGSYVESLDDLEKVTYVKPMLAQSYDTKRVVFPVLVNPKLDGTRCVIHAEGAFTREGKPYASIPHIIDALSQIINDYPGIVFDGELYNHELKDDFNKIISMVKKAKPSKKDLEESEDKVEYHVYDITGPGFDNLTAIERSKKIFELLNGLSDFIVPLRSVVAENFETIDAEYGWCLENGYEGQMIRLNTPYEYKRTHNLMKRKEFITEEFEIVEIHEGLGRWANKAKVVDIRLKDGRISSSGMRGNEGYLTQVLIDKEDYVGGEVTVRFPNLTPDGVPRFPVAVALFKGKRDV